MSDTPPAFDASPGNGPAYRAARLAVIILSALIVLAVIALVAGAAINLTGHGRSARGAAGSQIILPPGARIVSMDSGAGRIVLRLRTAEGEEIDIFDTETGRLVERIVTAPGEK